MIKKQSQTDKFAISIITVVKNGEKTIESTIKSIVCQKTDKIEYIIVDGNSSDNTIAIINKYIKYVDCFICDNDQGIYDAMNKAILYAQGKYVAFLNADDRYEPDALAFFLEESYFDPDIVYGGVRKIMDGKAIGFVGDYGAIDPDVVYYKNPYCHQGMLIKKELFDVIGKYDIRYKIYADYDWVLRAHEKGIKIKCIEKIVANSNTGGVSNRLTWNKCKELISVTNKYIKDDSERSLGIKKNNMNIENDFKYKFVLKNKPELVSNTLSRDKYANYYIWGTGKCAAQCTDLMRALNISIVAYIDNNKEVHKYNGFNVYFSEEAYRLFASDEETGDRMIIISSVKYEDEIVAQVNNWRIRNLAYIRFSDIKREIAQEISDLNWSLFGDEEL